MLVMLSTYHLGKLITKKERERDSIIVFRGQIGPILTKNITFHVIIESESWFSMFKNFTIEILQWKVCIVVVREICARIKFGSRCVESVVEYAFFQTIFLYLTSNGNTKFCFLYVFKIFFLSSYLDFKKSMWGTFLNLLHGLDLNGKWSRVK